MFLLFGPCNACANVSHAAGKWEDNSGEALKASAPHLRAPTLRKMAVVMLYHMRAIMAMTFDPNAPNAPGVPEELRISVRSWLAARLLPHNGNLKRKAT